MALTKFKTKGFKTKSEATEWAKDQKKQAGQSYEMKWETNRDSRPGAPFPWIAVLYRDV